MFPLRRAAGHPDGRFGGRSGKETWSEYAVVLERVDPEARFLEARFPGLLRAVLASARNERSKIKTSEAPGRG